MGGTFTDIVVYDSSSASLKILKLPTSTAPSKAILHGLRALSIRPDEVLLLAHATTLATNSLLTRTGLARTALVTNRGFRDVLEIGRQRRPELYDLSTRRPDPLVRRRDRLTVAGRVGHNGAIIEPLHEKDARGVARLIVERGFEAVAISFLNSYANPAHERLMRDALKSEGYAGHVSISSEVDPEYREFERTSTTVVNAVLAPMMAGYLSELSSFLRGLGIRAPLCVMNSDGGMSTAAGAAARPSMTIESGPAAGVVASCRLAARLGLPRVLTFDMGGTTAKACTIDGASPDVTREFEAAGRVHSGRSITGSGYTVRGSFIDIAEVSAGGGTIAWLDEAGRLQVGPRSAGSQPGPACYGKGGTEPTVTDADVVSGRISPDHLLGGNMKVDGELAVGALRRLSSRYGAPIAEIARDVIRLVSDEMSRAISIVSFERGRDPRDFDMVAFGGAGPVHACDLAEAVGVRRILVPLHAGVFSAYGLVAGDVTRTFIAPVMAAPGGLKTRFERLQVEVEREMAREGFPRFASELFIEARYAGQGHELLLRYDGDQRVTTAFHEKHKALYGYSLSDSVQVVNIGVKARSARAQPEGVSMAAPARRVPPHRRDAWVGGATQQVDVFTRDALRVGDEGRGPCVIEEYDSTLVVNPDWKWVAESYGTRVER